MAFDAGHLPPLDLLGNRHCNPRQKPLSASERDRVTKAVEAAETQLKEMREGARLTQNDELIAWSRSGSCQTVLVEERHIETVRDQAEEQLKNKAQPKRFLDDMQKRFDNPEVYASYVAAQEAATAMSKTGRSPLQVSGSNPDGTPGWFVIATADLPGEGLRRHGQKAIYALVTRTLADAFHEIGTLTASERDALRDLTFEQAKAERWAQILPGR